MKIIDSFFTVINEINLNDFLTQNPLLRVEAETYGHFGVGPVDELSPIYYGAEPNEKEGLGMYNDLYYFNPNGSFRVFTSGDIFGKAAAITQAFGNDEGLIENQFGEFENYPIEDINSNWIVNSENSSQLSLSENGFLGFFHEDGLTYDFISSDENSITQFSPVDGGFVYIKNNGELWGAGANFYTGKWFPLSQPRRIGVKSDWKKLHDFLGSEKNIILEDNQNTIWGAGTNEYLTLTSDPCPEPRVERWEVEVNHRLVAQKFNISISAITGKASITINVGDQVLSANVSSSSASTTFVSDLFADFNSKRGPMKG